MQHALSVYWDNLAVRVSMDAHGSIIFVKFLSLRSD